MKDNIQPCEVIESNLLDPTKETDIKTEFAEVIEIDRIAEKLLKGLGLTASTLCSKKTFHTGGTLKQTIDYKTKP